LKKKTILILICFIITLYILSSHSNFYLIKFQKIQLKLTQDFIFNIKKINNFYWIVIIFLYGIVHSLGPGHGKTLLATNCLNYKKSNIFLLAAFISYTQGIISFFFMNFLLWCNKTILSSQIKNIDKISIKSYFILLILIGIYGLLHEKFEKIKKFNFIAATGFIPCSGIINLLLVANLLGYQQYFFIITFIMSTGVFCTLVLFLIAFNKADSFFLESNNKKFFSIIIPIFLIALGLYGSFNI